jgi:hypothetical protein
LTGEPDHTAFNHYQRWRSPGSGVGVLTGFVVR